VERQKYPNKKIKNPYDLKRTACPNNIKQHPKYMEFLTNRYDLPATILSGKSYGKGEPVPGNRKPQIAPIIVTIPAIIEVNPIKANTPLSKTNKLKLVILKVY
jgi:hypothetical protein